MGSFWACEGQLGRPWDLTCGLRGRSCEKLSKLGLQMGGFGVLGASLGRSGAPFCGPGEQKECPEVFKIRFCGHRENIDIPVCFWCFLRLGTAGGAPNGHLEGLLRSTWGSWGQLGIHCGHLWDICGPCVAPSAALECQK